MKGQVMRMCGHVELHTQANAEFIKGFVSKLPIRKEVLFFGQQ
jgi:hypothetical protein